MVTQALKTVIQIGGGVTDGLLNSFNPLRKKLQETERAVARNTRAARSFERAMRSTTDPARLERLKRRHTDILQTIKEQRRETARLTRASNQYSESLARISPLLAKLGLGVVFIRKVFRGVLQDFAEFKEVQAETGIEAARLAAISFQARPLVPGLRPERIADLTAQAVRETELRLQEAAAGRVGLKGYLVLPNILQATNRGTMEPIQQLAVAIRHIQKMPAHRRASALEEVVGGTEGEFITGLFRRGRIDDYLKALEASTGSIYRAGTALDRFWSVLIEVQQSFLLLGYTLINFVTPVLEPLATIARWLALQFQALLRNSGLAGEIIGTYLVSAALVASVALTVLAVKAIIPAIGSIFGMTVAAIQFGLTMIGISAPIAVVAIAFFGLATALTGLIFLLRQFDVLRLPESEGPTQGFGTQNNTFNINGAGNPDALAMSISQRLGRDIGNSLLARP